MTFEGQKYILASSLLVEERLRVLKHEETFAIFDRLGHIDSAEEGEEGLYNGGTRFLSRLDFDFESARPLLLNSSVTDDNLIFAMDFTNPDFIDQSGRSILRGSIHVFRSLFLSENSCLEKLKLTSFLHHDLALPVCYHFDADFKDIFEVRGYHRPKRGELQEPIWSLTECVLSYKGLDGVIRQTRIRWDGDVKPIFDEENGRMVFPFAFSPSDREHTIYLSYDMLIDPQPSSETPMSSEARYKEKIEARRRSLLQSATGDCEISTSNEQFNDWLKRSYADLHAMITKTEHGIYPYAGVPWFCTTFGRDGIVTALQTLMINPAIARGVLTFLSRTQALEVSATNDAEPGKILHEARSGEMANLSEIPFGKYYGSVDATPLFVVLAGEYFKVTNDLSFIQTLWPSLLRAIDWIDQYGDLDQDGFVEYSRQTSRGLVNQGWKDSHDSIFHRDGMDASPPIALCEIQGYVFQAKLSAAMLARALGDFARADRWTNQAYELKDLFHKKFWSDEIGGYVLALDGSKKQCAVRSSNVGHCLYSGIVDHQVADQVISDLMSEKFFSGWGIRTIAKGEIRYNPMSYHNGSVWPHDTSIIAAGMSRYGYMESVCQLMSGLFEASAFLDLSRLPELFCGFTRRPRQGPTLYPLSCAPQAWSAGSVFLLLQSSLGLRFSAQEKQITFDRPTLPPSLKKVDLKGLRLGDTLVDIEAVRHPSGVGINVNYRSDEIKVVVTK